jgi:hypothetical protein
MPIYIGIFVVIRTVPGKDKNISVYLPVLHSYARLDSPKIITPRARMRSKG